MTPLPPVELAHVPPFRLGNVEVHPATRQIVRDGRSETVEPRVMQVIVALVEARGRILTHDELIMRCWGGRVVGDNAIRRAVSQVRNIAAEIADGAFELETITKVGYRLVVHGGEAMADAEDAVVPFDEPPRRGPDRRLVIGAGVAALAAAGIGAYALLPRRSSEVAELLRRGELALRHGMPEQSRQGLAFYRLAVERAPDDAEAWGGLALAYHNMFGWTDDEESQNMARLGRSAAKRAVALDPDNADGHVALAILDPYFGRWLAAERALAELVARFPDHWLLRVQRAALCYETGRWREGSTHSQHALRIDSFLPNARLLWARALWSTDRLHEAEAELKQGLASWPGHWPLWNGLFTFYLATGRAEAAVALARNSDLQPMNMAPGAVDKRIALARYVVAPAPAERDRLLAIYLDEAHASAGANVANLIPVFIALHAPAVLFDLLDAYYLDRGPYRFERRGRVSRYTNLLFLPPMAPFRPDPRFTRLMADTGLETFWRQSGRTPDYRR